MSFRTFFLFFCTKFNFKITRSSPSFRTMFIRTSIDPHLREDDDINREDDDKNREIDDINRVDDDKK